MERYEAYKDSGVEWIGEIPATWQMLRIQQCFAEERRINDGLESFHALKFSAGSIVPKPEIWDEGEIADTYARYRYVSPGTIMINNLNLNFDLKSLRVGLVEEEGIITSAYVAIVPGAEIQPRFANYVLKSWDYRKAFHNMGKGLRLTLDWHELSKYRIQTPSLCEQQAIADYLDAKTAEIDALVADCEREVELLREYRKAVISEAVTKGLDPDAPMKDSGIEWIGEIPQHWDAGKLLRHARLESGHTPSRLHPEWWIEDECTIPWITTQDVHRFRDGRITSIDDTELHVSQIGLDNSSARWLPAGTVALSRTASVGFSIVLSKPMASSQDFADWVPDESLDSFYLLYSLRSMDMVFKQLQMGSTHKTIYMPDIMKLAVAYPPLEEQRQIVNHLDAITDEIDFLIEAKQSMADKLREYRRSLISEAVTGKFKVPGA